jgi:hypothetical protein
MLCQLSWFFLTHISDGKLMPKIIFSLISLLLFVPQLTFADAPPNLSLLDKAQNGDPNAKSLLSVSSCVDWFPSTPVDQEALESLKKKSTTEKPANGDSYTKNQLIVLIGKNYSGAKDALANHKNKLQKTSDGLVDLRGATLDGFNLSGLNLDYVDLKGADMRGANLSGATLNNAILYKADLEGANLDHAKINFSNVSKTKLINAHICEASLFYSDIEDAVFRGAYMKGARLDSAKNIPGILYFHSHSIFELGLSVPPNNMEP